MDKFTVARTLDEIGRYLALTESNPFKSRAFDRAARAIEALDADVAKLVASGEIKNVSGIGKATAEIVAEIINTGSSTYLEELRAQFPPGIFDLLRIPKLGLKKIGQLYAELGIASIDALEEAARNGQIAKLKGFGPKTAQQILGGVEFARQRQSKFLLPRGIEAGERIRMLLADIAEIEDAEVSGSVRRRLEICRNVNIVVATKKLESVLAKLPDILDGLEMLDEQTAKGTTGRDIEVRLHFTTPAEFGAELLRTTGSEEFVSAFGKIPKGRTEQDVFEKRHIAFVEPERREDASELSRKKRVRLVQASDLRGTFHVHTTFSDGRNTMHEMLSAAKERGYEYVGISDHSKSAYYAGGLTEDRLREQHAEITAQEKAVKPMRVFRGTEADILGDGSIDYGPDTLRKFDFVIASVHSQFQMQKDQMTERILRALDDPSVTFLGHMTGRRLLTRDGYTFDYDRVFERAGERGVMIEINGNPQRLDIDWRLVKRALDRGVVFSIHPDAHSISEYNAMITGTWAARKAGLTKKEIFNARGLDEVAEFLAARRKNRTAGL
ncbi:MAG TPA: PHP domain-containing protein [Thermoanaerobaculia bacterium]|nr:PHP domain-containing protein [Thermoanaerobaculia bacterium]